MFLRVLFLFPFMHVLISSWVKIIGKNNGVKFLKFSIAYD